ncbi:uncharacterized protein LOC143286878 [Babylonia areolata]|uniref:uncharacterized protein LOC143286878 n=1 Tax=Babylonia areolata TaxID=304850 RepID=UPI003FD63511
MSARNSGNQEQGAGQDDDDDFGEFGGFEAADPMESLGVAGGQAAAAPWAALASASAGSRHQPDLLCPQNTFPTYLDPSGIAGSPLHAVADHSQPLNGGAQDDPAQFDDGSQHPQRLAAERPFHGNGSVPMADVLDGTFNSVAPHSRGASAASYPANGMLPDIGLGTNQSPLFAERPMGVDVSQNAQSHAEAAPAEEAAAVGELGEVIAPDNQAGLQQAEAAHRGQEDEERGAGGEGEVARLQEEPPPAAAEAVGVVVDEAEQNRLQREIASLQSSNLVLTQQLERSQADLETQRSRLQEVQQQHLEQLEAVRQAGHDTLAVVVEQYKEQSRTAVLEQQESSQHHLVEVMEQQLQTFQRAIQAQREDAERERGEAQRQMQDQMAAALESMRTEQQEKFDSYLAEERAKQEAAIKQAVEEEQSRCRQQMQEAIAAEQSKAKEQLDRTKEQHEQELEEQRRRYENLLQERCQQEREEAQERLTFCLEEERQRGREMTDRALHEARADREAYVQQQRQTDAALRRRQLASLDLFLESARRQIDLLLNSDPSPPAVAPQPPPPHPPDEQEDQ